MKEPFEMSVQRVNIKGDNQKLLMRVALAADLHNKPCERYIAALSAENPDLICIAGDLMECFAPDDLSAKLADLDSQSKRYPKWKKAVYRALIRLDALFAGRRKRRQFDMENRNAFEFLHAASEIAPTYYAPGNHERFMSDEVRRRVAQLGAKLLDNEYARTEVRGVEVLVGGVGNPLKESWLDDFSAQKTTGVKLLLCHQPEYFDEYLQQRDTGIVLSGHAHGGQWRIGGRPFFAPGQGLLPKYTSGLYNDRLVVSRGLSNTANVPRFGNPLQLVIVDVWKCPEA